MDTPTPLTTPPITTTVADAQKTEATTAVPGSPPGDGSPADLVVDAKEEKLASPQLAALARKEKKLRQEREAWEKEQSTSKTERETFEKQRQAFEASRKSFLEDPIAFAKSVKEDLTSDEILVLAQHFYIEAMGDKAPEEMRKQVKRKEKTPDELFKEWEAKQSQERETTDRKAAMQQYETGLFSHFNTSIESLPFTKALAEHDSDYATNLIRQFASQGLVASDERYLKADFVAAEFEKNLSQQLELFRHLLTPSAPPQEPATSPVPTEKVSSTKTLSTKQTSTQPDKRKPTEAEARQNAIEYIKQMRTGRANT